MWEGATIPAGGRRLGVARGKEEDRNRRISSRRKGCGGARWGWGLEELWEQSHGDEPSRERQEQTA